MNPCLCTFSVVLETSQCAKKGLKQNSHKCYQIVSSCWPHCWRVNCVLARRFETMPMKANDAVVPTMQLWQGGFFERCNSPPENLFCCGWSFARLHIWSSSLWHQRVYILFHISSLQKTTKWCRCYDAAALKSSLQPLRSWESTFCVRLQAGWRACPQVLAIEMMNMKKELRTGSKSWDQRIWWCI